MKVKVANKTQLLDELYALLDDLVDQTVEEDPKDNVIWKTGWIMHVLTQALSVTDDSYFADHFTSIMNWAEPARGGYDEIRKKEVTGFLNSKYTEGKRHLWSVHVGWHSSALARFSEVADTKNMPNYVRMFAKDAWEWAEKDMACVQEDERDSQIIKSGFCFMKKKVPAAYLFSPYLNRRAPQNFASLYALALIYLDRIDEAKRHLNFWTDKLVEEKDGSLLWGYTPGMPWRTDVEKIGDRYTDIGHAGNDIFFAVVAYEYGLLSKEKLNGFVETLFNRVVVDDKIYDRVNGGGAFGTYDKHIMEWSPLALYSERVRDYMLSILDDKHKERFKSKPMRALALAYVLETL